MEHFATKEPDFPKLAEANWTYPNLKNSAEQSKITTEYIDTVNSSLYQHCKGVWIKNNYASVCFHVSVPVKQMRMSQVSNCAAIPLADSLMGSNLALDLAGNVTQHQHMLIFSCTVILNSVLFNFDLFFLSVSFIPSLAISPTPTLWSRLVVLPFCHDEGSCLFPDAQTLFMVPLNNSALMEIFNIAC